MTSRMFAPTVECLKFVLYLIKIFREDDTSIDNENILEAKNNIKKKNWLWLDWCNITGHAIL